MWRPLNRQAEWWWKPPPHKMDRFLPRREFSIHRTGSGWIVERRCRPVSLPVRYLLRADFHKKDKSISPWELRSGRMDKSPGHAWMRAQDSLPVPKSKTSHKKGKTSMQASGSCRSAGRFHRRAFQGALIRKSRRLAEAAGLACSAEFDVEIGVPRIHRQPTLRRAIDGVPLHQRRGALLLRLTDLSS